MSDYMPPIEVYLAMAEAIHDEDEVCDEAGAAFAECPWREHDIQQAIATLQTLRRADWWLVRAPAGVPGLGL